MEGQEGGEAQQKEETSKRHTYPLIRVNKETFLNLKFVNFLNNFRIVICMTK
jgi:hypothetical protein